jgi:uncharacterized protein (DUF2235 family)
MPDMKRIVICCDGTWNDADSDANFTNVVRLARSVESHDTRKGKSVAQIVYYQSGVGSSGDLVGRVVGGGVGMGLSRNIRDAYAFVANNYCDGDEIFLFGFSRGAYTARSIAGLIGYAGILHKGDMDDFSLLWEGYRFKDKPGQPDVREQFPDRHKTVGVRCIGVWDTVGSLGVPGHLDLLFKDFYQFHDTNLGPRVQFAFHALALDEHRKDFEPTLWQQTDEGRQNGQVMEQVWFAGAHSNVGGGYDEHGLSDVALAWMADRVSPLLALDVAGYLSTKRDRRAQWACGKLYDSADGEWRLRPRIDRRVFDPALAERTSEAIHPSVATRLAIGAPCDPAPYACASLNGVDLAAKTAALGPVEQTLQWAATVAPAAVAARPKPTFLSKVLGVFGGS